MQEKTQDINLRTKLRELEIKIMDLSEFLEISRPTLYKMIELYQKRELEKIPSYLIALFDYMQNPYINKNNVIQYIVQNIIRVKNPLDRTQQREMIKNLIFPPNSTKEEFITMVLHTNRFDEILGYLLTCNEILKKDIPTMQERETLTPLENLYRALGKII
ncbi:hypothetical protein CQA53_09045 [Helicobacter didelphidarum]|uniref:Uncharacterized protein n=1 Tax=Helicobacter didelphidarum TaxID=2040648 RepID=A0A3D8ICC3_9HELI|nr:hypothetical protein [Helicobacter didelphidarum]RDU62843.1 hypothetical protein CQA53_09045 [Helicobacter didelphidarum]